MNLPVVPSGKDDAILYYAVSIRKGKKTTSKNVGRIGRLSELKKEYAEILRTLRDYEAVDAESFYVGAMEGKAVRALESTFGLAGSMAAFSKAQFRRLVARSKKEKI